MIAFIMQNPQVVSYWIMFNFFLGLVAFAIAGRWWDVLYWFASILIVVSVTFRGGG